MASTNMVLTLLSFVSVSVSPIIEEVSLVPLNPLPVDCIMCLHELEYATSSAHELSISFWLPDAPDHIGCPFTVEDHYNARPLDAMLKEEEESFTFFWRLASG